MRNAFSNRRSPTLTLGRSFIGREDAMLTGRELVSSAARIGCPPEYFARFLRDPPSPAALSSLGRKTRECACGPLC